MAHTRQTHSRAASLDDDTGTRTDEGGGGHLDVHRGVGDQVFLQVDLALVVARVDADWSARARPAHVRRRRPAARFACSSARCYGVGELLQRLFGLVGPHLDDAVERPGRWRWGGQLGGLAHPGLQAPAVPTVSVQVIASVSEAPLLIAVNVALRQHRPR